MAFFQLQQQNAKKKKNSNNTKPQGGNKVARNENERENKRLPPAATNLPTNELTIACEEIPTMR